MVKRFKYGNGSVFWANLFSSSANERNRKRALIAAKVGTMERRALLGAPVRVIALASLPGAAGSTLTWVCIEMRP
jgi:hypothetical protein